MKIRKFLIALLFIPIFTACETDGEINSSGPGKGGSLARFAVIGDYLYTVEDQSLKVFSIEDRANPIYLSKHILDVDVETIFPRDSNTLFIGTIQGMYIYDVSNAPNINLISSYAHIVSCDPVVANDKYAYVTLHSDENSNVCFRNVNQLDIVDISDLQSPVLVNSFPMVQPLGLALYGDTLLVCDAGVKVLDVSDPMDIKLLNAIEEIEAIDLIINGDLVIVAKTDGLEQYRYKNKDLIFLSKI